MKLKRADDALLEVCAAEEGEDIDRESAMRGVIMDLRKVDDIMGTWDIIGESKWREWRKRVYTQKPLMIVGNLAIQCVN